jgi:hypothetical protein
VDATDFLVFNNAFKKLKTNGTRSQGSCNLIQNIKIKISEELNQITKNKGSDKHCAALY